jgi:hypothetical protein
MSGLPAEAKVPRTSGTVRSFSSLCPNPQFSRSKESARRGEGPAPGRKKLWREGRLQAELHKKARADSSRWEIHPRPRYDHLAGGCSLPR